VADEIIVETNWVLDVALHQDEASGTLFEYARAGYAQLFLPSFCVAEAIKAVETKQSLRLTAQFRDLFNVSPADSTVLATVAEVRRAGLCSRFMSRDAVFEGPGPGGWPEREGGG